MFGCFFGLLGLFVEKGFTVAQAGLKFNIYLRMPLSLLILQPHLPSAETAACTSVLSLCSAGSGPKGFLRTSILPREPHPEPRG